VRDGFRDIAVFDEGFNIIGIARETIPADGTPGLRSFALVLNGSGNSP
jgi:hypothetical protein